jgi:hypothetical protein
MSYQSVNPTTGKVIQTVADLTDGQLDAALATAAAHYEVWRRKSYAERAVVVRKAASLLAARVDAFARPATLEMGKRIGEARGEVEFSARILAYYADNAERFLAPVKLDPAVGEAHLESSPLGVIFCVEPWNFPYYQLARVAGPHLMAGNVLMVKHAGCVPQCAAAFAQLWIDAGAPAGLYTNLITAGEKLDAAREAALAAAGMDHVQLSVQGAEAAGHRQGYGGEDGQGMDPALELGRQHEEDQQQRQAEGRRDRAARLLLIAGCSTPLGGNDALRLFLRDACHELGRVHQRGAGVQIGRNRYRPLAIQPSTVRRIPGGFGRDQGR